MIPARFDTWCFESVRELSSYRSLAQQLPRSWTVIMQRKRAQERVDLRLRRLSGAATHKRHIHYYFNDKPWALQCPTTMNTDIIMTKTVCVFGMLLFLDGLDVPSLTYSLRSLIKINPFDQFLEREREREREKERARERDTVRKTHGVNVYVMVNSCECHG